MKARNGSFLSAVFVVLLIAVVVQVSGGIKLPNIGMSLHAMVGEINTSSPLSGLSLPSSPASQLIEGIDSMGQLLNQQIGTNTSIATSASKREPQVVLLSTARFN